MDIRAVEQPQIHLGFNRFGAHTGTKTQSRLSTDIYEALIIFYVYSQLLLWIMYV
jgi:hypothetical protein